MIRNYFKTAFRSFRTDRPYALINIFGLAVALTILLLTVAYIRHELAFDRHLTHADRLYRVVMEDRSTEVEKVNALVPRPLGNTLSDVFPEIAGTTTFHPAPRENTIYRAAGKEYPLNVLLIDQHFFELFDLPLLEGNLSTALTPDEAVISERMAKTYFPNGEVVGQTLERTLDNGQKTVVTIRAVINDIPAHTHFYGDLLLAAPHYGEETLNFKSFSATSQYLMLQAGIESAAFAGKMNQYLRENFEFRENETVRLIPVTDIHLKSSHIENIAPRQHDIRFIYLFGFIALLILAIACINYINLSTARYLQKIKEMGVRKVLGASKSQLCTQVFAESLLLFGFSLPLATALSWFVRPVFSQLFDISDHAAYLINASNLLIIVLTALATSFLASIYPALILIRRPVTQLFKQKLDDIRMSFGPRKMLIAFQFSITVILIVATLVVHSQLQMLSNRSMGFEKDHLLILTRTQNGAALKQQLLQIPTISDVSFAGSVEIGRGYGARSSMEDPNDPTASWDFSFVDADFDFYNTMKLELLDGRYFNESYGTDIIHPDSMSVRHIRFEQPIVVTESTARNLGIHSVDTLIQLGALQGKIVGIIRDFRMTSFKEQGAMVVLRASANLRGNAYVRIASHDIPKTLSAVEAAWKHTAPHSTFDYYFADEKIQQLYQKEDNLARLFNVFSVLAIAISTLGLFSLVSLMVKHRTKEIGIRKVVGAGLWDITRLFTRDFTAVMGISILIAIPVSWWTMNKWLEDYAYRIEISAWTLGAAALIAVVITLVTVSGQAIRAGLANPVESLRDE